MSRPLVGRESYSCGPSHSELGGPGGAVGRQGAHSGWVFVGSCKSPTSRRGAWQRIRSLDLALGSRTGGFDREWMEPLGAGTGGSGSVEHQGGGAGETPVRNEGSSGTGRRADDPVRRSTGWSS